MSNKRTGRMPPGHPGKIDQRCHGMCEGCHQKPAMNLHHRRFLSRDGKHNLANLVALCGSGNHSGCHGDAHGSHPLPSCSSCHGRGISSGHSCSCTREPQEAA